MVVIVSHSYYLEDEGQYDQGTKYTLAKGDLPPIFTK